MDPSTVAMTDADALAVPETISAPEPLAQAPDLNILPSVLTDLRNLRSQIGAGAKPIQIPLPGYKGKLVASFRWVPANELGATSKSLRAIKDPTQLQIAAAADALVATNDEILVEVDGKLESLLHQGVNVTFATGEGLCLALQLPKPNSARECVVSVLGNEYGLLDIATKVMTWLEDTTRTVDESFLGE
jgi:hypothetical protein